MPTLCEAIQDPSRRAMAIADVYALLESEMEKKRGLTGLALKAGYGMLKAVKPGFIPDLVAMLLDESASNLQPIMDEAGPRGMGAGAYLATQQTRVAEALLEVTDARAAKTPHLAIKTMYEKLRGVAKSHVAEAVPRLAEIVDRVVA